MEIQEMTNLAKIVQAIGRRRDVEYKIGEMDWAIYKYSNRRKLGMDIANGYVFRIKPEPRRIPLNQQDLIERELSGKAMRIKYGYGYSLITDFNEQNVYLSDDEFTYEQLSKLEWIDDTPCSKESECE